MSRGRPLHPMVSMGLARLGSLVPVSVASLVLSRLVIEHYGVAVFNGFALVVSTMALLPPTLTDLGVGTGVTTSYAEVGPDHPESRRLALTAARALAGFTTGVVVVALGLSVAGLWPEILGDGAEAGGVFGIAMAVYALGFLPGLGQSMLLGVNRSHLTVLVVTMHLPLTAILAGVAVVVDAPEWAIVILPAATMTLVRLLLAAVTARVVAAVDWWLLLARVPRPRRHPGAKIRGTAVPALVIALAVPAALQGDRLILSHMTTDAELAAYAVSIQIFAPVLGVLVALAQPLWPMYAQARAHGTPAPSLWKVTAVFVAGTAALCAVLVAIADPAGRVISGDAVDLGVALPLANAWVVLAIAASLPISMAMRDPAGLRFAATWSVIGLSANLPLSVLLAERWGAPGPLVASAAAGLVLQLVPAVIYYRRRYTTATPTAEPPPEMLPVGFP